MSIPLRLRDRALDLEPGKPVLMGILNAAPDSFSDPGGDPPERLVERGLALAADGAAIVDVGGESGRTDREAVSTAEEADRVVPVIEVLAAEGVLVSVDTWRAEVAREALTAGAAMVNDVSALSEPDVAAACAEAGAALVVTHTRVPPKHKGFPDYDDVLDDVEELLAERASVARERGVADEQLVFDPGIDLAKTPAQSVEVLRRLPDLTTFGRPLLLAVSRKDFIGALTGRTPAERDGGTLAAVGAAAAAGASIVRVHDVAGATDYLRVRAALRGEGPVPGELRLDEALRTEPAA